LKLEHWRFSGFFRILSRKLQSRNDQTIRNCKNDDFGKNPRYIGSWELSRFTICRFYDFITFRILNLEARTLAFFRFFLDSEMPVAEPQLPNLSKKPKVDRLLGAFPFSDLRVYDFRSF
jgi:hypothetical protein